MKFKEEISSIKITTLFENKAEKGTKVLGQHGISFFIEMTVNNKKQYLLFDTGQQSETLLKNAEILNINLENIEMIFLSHCHYDHTGGLTGLLENLNQDVIITAHPEIFKEAYKEKNGKLNYVGIPDKDPEEKIIKNKGKIDYLKEPCEIMPGVMTTGEVHKKAIFPSKRVYRTSEGEYVKDVMKDDISLIFNIKEKGLLVITGCSHSGIVEIVDQSMNMIGNKRLQGIIGGFHLLNKNDDEVREISKKLKEYNPEILVTGHCTGFDAMAILKQDFKEKFEELYVGKIIEI